MLILTRKKGESIIINGNIEVQIIESEEGKVKIGINAPKEIEVHRQEVFDRIKNDNFAASKSEISLLQEHLKKNK